MEEARRLKADREAGKEGKPATVPEVLRLLVAVAGRQAEKPKPPKAPKKAGMDESVVRNGGGAALLRVEGKDRKGLSVTPFHKGGGTREAAEKALMDLLDHHRSAEHTSELQSLTRISSAGFCLKQIPTTT